MAEGGWIYFIDGREPYDLQEGLYEAFLHHEGDPPDRPSESVRRSRDARWTREGGGLLFPRDTILRVRRLGD